MEQSTIRILGGGATQRLVMNFAEGFERTHGVRLHGDFGAVGGMRDRVLAGEAVDLILLTEEIVDALSRSGHVIASSKRAIGSVATSVAVPAGRPHPPLDSERQVADALRASGEIHFPDPERATAGIHFHGVMERLGLLPALRDRLRTHPNGMTAMQALADCTDGTAIGCTQTTEILATQGVELVAELPGSVGLRTLYCGAIGSRSPDAARAAGFLETLVADATIAFRREIGFRP